MPSLEETMEDNQNEAADEEETEEAAEEDREEPAGDKKQPAAEEGDASLEEILAQREARPAEEEEEDDSMLAMERDERIEPLAVKVVPPTDKEFVCSNCHLVKHRSQLADRKRTLCRDCV